MTVGGGVGVGGGGMRVLGRSNTIARVGVRVNCSVVAATPVATMIGVLLTWLAGVAVASSSSRVEEDKAPKLQMPTKTNKIANRINTRRFM
jgi:hypothetical protein